MTPIDFAVASNWIAAGEVIAAVIVLAVARYYVRRLLISVQHARRRET